MGDFSLEWGGDLSASPSGDFAVATGDVRSRQRVTRRLLSNPRVVLADGSILAPDYPYDPSFGAGLGRYIGSNIARSSVSNITALVQAALRGEDTVDQTQPVSVVVTRFEGGVRLQISYVVLETGNRISLPNLIAS